MAEYGITSRPPLNVPATLTNTQTPSSPAQTSYPTSPPVNYHGLYLRQEPGASTLIRATLRCLNSLPFNLSLLPHPPLTSRIDRTVEYSDHTGSPLTTYSEKPSLSLSLCIRTNHTPDNPQLPCSTTSCKMNGFGSSSAATTRSNRAHCFAQSYAYLVLTSISQKTKKERISDVLGQLGTGKEDPSVESQINLLGGKGSGAGSSSMASASDPSSGAGMNATPSGLGGGASNGINAGSFGDSSTASSAGTFGSNAINAGFGDSVKAVDTDIVHKQAPIQLPTQTQAQSGFRSPALANTTTAANAGMGMVGSNSFVVNRVPAAMTSSAAGVNPTALRNIPSASQATSRRHRGNKFDFVRDHTIRRSQAPIHRAANPLISAEWTSNKKSFKYTMAALSKTQTRFLAHVAAKKGTHAPKLRQLHRRLVSHGAKAQRTKAKFLAKQWEVVKDYFLFYRENNLSFSIDQLRKGGNMAAEESQRLSKFLSALTSCLSKVRKATLSSARLSAAGWNAGQMFAFASFLESHAQHTKEFRIFSVITETLSRLGRRMWATYGCDTMLVDGGTPELRYVMDMRRLQEFFGNAVDVVTTLPTAENISAGQLRYWSFDAFVEMQGRLAGMVLPNAPDVDHEVHKELNELFAAYLKVTDSFEEKEKAKAKAQGRRAETMSSRVFNAAGRELSHMLNAWGSTPEKSPEKLTTDDFMQMGPAIEAALEAMKHAEGNGQQLNAADIVNDDWDLPLFHSFVDWIMQFQDMTGYWGEFFQGLNKMRSVLPHMT
ncbi:hypothetical protein CC80DRAFT_507562 [Byssothecium circinans]|uniref:Uncharacterized protein n=1 Tax=Byssothecium circinans TaxID=147558 RepID=A0A6A5TK81_9PLEO|nr:hypothetical protein CC80DRAFT_507562 [Byssothecium circinans]